jgi:hypothetical protein
MKLMAPGGRVYMLYDLSRDEAELNDLSRQDRPLLARMLEAYDEKLSSLHEIHVDPIP